TEAGRVREDTPREGTQADGATTGRATSLPSIQEGSCRGPTASATALGSRLGSEETSR
ncbi:hypothetical protein KI387_007627, partial [Taxus chinensis]